MAWRLPYGAMSAANWIAMNASNHFHRYGTTRDALGAIAVNARRNAGLNPDAIYRDPMTMDDYFGGPDDHQPLRPVRLRRSLRRLDRRRGVGGGRRRDLPPSRRSWSTRWAPRSSTGSAGTRAR